MEWFWLSELHKLSDTMVEAPSDIHDTFVCAQRLPSFVKERERRWLDLSWKVQSAMWIENHTEFTVIRDGRIITAIGFPNHELGFKALRVYRIPSLVGDVVQHTVDVRVVDAPPIWAFNWSKDRNCLLVLRGHSPWYVLEINLRA